MTPPIPSPQRLTNSVVAAAPIPPAGPDGKVAQYKVRDSDIDGFILRVRSTGSKTFELRYRMPGGKEHQMTLGRFPEMTASQARQDAQAKRGEIAEARRSFTGADPLEKRRRAARSSKARQQAPTVAVLFDRFLAESKTKCRPSTFAEYQRLLGVVTVKRGPAKGSEKVGEVRAALGKLKVADVEAEHIEKLHQSMKDRPTLANRVLAITSAAFTYAERHKARPAGSNPCRHVKPYEERSVERYLTDAEYARIGEALSRAATEGLPVPPAKAARRLPARKRNKDGKPDRRRGPRPLKRFSPVGVGALRFLLLTGWRLSEVRDLRWHNIENGVATLHRTKTGSSQRTLGAPALEVLEEMRAYRQRNNQHVFPGTIEGKPFTDIRRIWEAVRHAAGLDDVRLHDLRHGFASVGASGGLTLPLIGKLLGHKHSATTQRYAHLTDSVRKRAADAVSGSIAAAIAGNQPEEAPSENVLPFRSA